VNSHLGLFVLFVRKKNENRHGDQKYQQNPQTNGQARNNWQLIKFLRVATIT
jgi:hypothetical protein